MVNKHKKLNLKDLTVASFVTQLNKRHLDRELMGGCGSFGDACTYDKRICGGDDVH